MTQEKTLVIFKPDVLQRQIVGELLTRFERKGFKIIGMKLTHPSRELVGEHYAASEDYLIEVGEKSLKSAKEQGEDTWNMTALEIGSQIRQWNIDYLTCGPVVAMVLQGPTIIQSVRNILGSTNPQNADIGTIRGDYSPDSFMLSNAQGRTTRTIVHASDSIESATREIPLWFNEDELFDYTTGIESILFDAGWSKS